MHKLSFILCFLLFFISIDVVYPQIKSPSFIPSKKDTLRGEFSRERSCYEVFYYDLNVKFDLKNKMLSGSNTVFFLTTTPTACLQLDLFANMFLDSIVYKAVRLNATRVLGTFYVHFPTPLDANKAESITVYYHGSPTVAAKPPWDGGIIWGKDPKHKPWVGMACEGLGASSWWPCKDMQSDKPDSMQCVYEVPDGLACIGNGTFVSKKKSPHGYQKYTWKINYPISAYNVTFNIGDYRQFQYQHRYKQDSLATDFYVLPHQLTKAKKHFLQSDTILQVFEQLFGKYPFQKDGYALVASPYLGMEHQSAIAYGSEFKNGYLNTDFIILHETAHEWWGNHVAVDDMAEMWISEAFATYSEWLYYEYLYGKKYVIPYALHQRKMIENKMPMLGVRQVNFPSLENIDIYYKGAWMLHTLRSWTNNDSLWFGSLHAIQDTFGMRTINTQILLEFMQRKLNIPLQIVANYYLTKTAIPIFEYELSSLIGEEYVFRYRWVVDNCPNFDLPIRLMLNGKEKLLPATASWQSFIITNVESKNILFRDGEYLVEFRRKEL